MNEINRVDVEASEELDMYGWECEASQQSYIKYLTNARSFRQKIQRKVRIVKTVNLRQETAL